MSEIRKINKSLENGILPDCLNFSVAYQADSFDWEKIKYNAFYRCYECAEKKFPPGYESIPGFDKVIEMCIPELTPLQEIEARQLSSQSIEILEKKNDD